MNKELLQDIYLKRSRIVVLFFWLFAVVPGTYTALGGDYSIFKTEMPIVVIAIAITILSRIRKLAIVTPYITICIFILFYGMLSMLGAADPTLPILFTVLATLYPSYRPVVLTAVALLAEILIFSKGTAMLPSQFLSKGVFSFLLIAAACITLVAITEKILQDVSRRGKELMSANEKTEELLEKVRFALDTLNQFSTHLQEKVSVTQRISSEVNMGFNEVAKGIGSQAESVSYINDLMHKSNQDIQDVAKNSEVMLELSAHTQNVTTQGNEQMIELRGNIDQANEIIQAVVQEMNRLNEQNSQIGSTLSTIQDIANQTNLLALNAAIEAAKAGEHGRGFAVVSSEIRKLAEHSSQSAIEIAEILQGIQQRTEQLTLQVGSGKAALDQSLESAHRSEDIFKQISENTLDVLDKAKEVEKKTTEIGRASGDIVMEVTSISGVTEQSSASAQQILASIDEQTRMVDQIVLSFKELERLITDLNQAAR